MPTNKEFIVEIGLGRPDRILFFDQFGFQRGPRFTDLDFVDRRSSAGLVVRMANDSLMLNRDPFLKYMKESGDTENSAPPQIHVSSPTAVLFADFIGLARHGAAAETIFHAVSWKIAIERTRPPDEKDKSSRPDPVIPSICVALLRCDADLQRHWIAALYAES